ncbi:toll/interleukin-1 receptor domain-containing protein [Bosea sp. RCC_152_1]|uniref:toll/interleukin-1 receptor domain-containing protein n=1 Tax=Bosea sp. RCC_152_1 TaxID=3239228 RepID=UPI003524161A
MLKKKWDAFISHASEDKNDIARPLANNLTRLGLRVWFDEFELKIGDSLSKNIDLGLSKSEFGIVILSNSFFKKDWTDYEFRGLVAKSIGANRTILPVWHNIERSDVINFSPSLADIMAANTNQSLDKLSIDIVSVINPSLHAAIIRKIINQKASINSQSEKIPLNLIEMAPIRHERLPIELIRRISIIRNVLSDVHPLSMAEWVDGFQRDTHPSKEIRVWEFIASRYLQIREAVQLSAQQKKTSC